jgi:hypothetical protein
MSTASSLIPVFQAMKKTPPALWVAFPVRL